MESCQSQTEIDVMLKRESWTWLGLGDGSIISSLLSVRCFQSPFWTGESL